MILKIISVLGLFNGALHAAEIVHHLEVKIEPVTHAISATDTVVLPQPLNELVFYLHKNFSPAVINNGAKLSELPAEEQAVSSGPNFSSATAVAAKYLLTFPHKVNTFTLSYGGEINHKPAEQAESYARSFSESAGLINEDGCYLAGSSFWYPDFKSQTARFTLKTELPQDYSALSTGNELPADTKQGLNTQHWDITPPLDELTLVCGKYIKYKLGKNPKLEVYLRKADDTLAQKYLKAAEVYTRMYSAMLGAYPYKKFALVENFWETGYGLPSFTLLGAKVIRLPFIINTSYPHEILHNWWGNGVFPDYNKGNWSEGLTAYLADYLLAENRGKGRDYRLTTLEKYSAYAAENKDFPLREFRSRTSSATEAVGYGKSLMFFHMLRRKIGDNKFKTALKEFYSRYRFKKASFEELKATFEDQTGENQLNEFFSQWIDRTGAPELALDNVIVQRYGGGYNLEFTVRQLQPGPPYTLDLTASIGLENVSLPRLPALTIKKKEEHFKYHLPLKPVSLALDPEFDIFRKISPLETPPNLAQLFGSRKPLILLPALAQSQQYQAYETLALNWNKDKDNAPEIRKDSDFSDLPQDRPVWILGRENRFYTAFTQQLNARGVRLTTGRAIIENQDFPLASDTFVFADYNPGNQNLSTGLIISGRADKLSQLATKLPHYGKYGYLVFDTEINIVKTGIWAGSDNSPLRKRLSPTQSTQIYPARTPLTAPENLFSDEIMKAHLYALSSEKYGRGQKDEGLEKAYRYLSRIFTQYGLTPFFTKDFSQSWTETGQMHKNLIAQLPGTKRPEEYIVISAHYDHLPTEEGRVYPGADDNASGLSLMLELARYYSQNKPDRSIIFAAFDAEEQDRAGSRYFVKSLPREVKEKINANINLDTVGRLNDGKILFLNSASSAKWIHILRGAGFVTGIDYEAPKKSFDSSDQASFIEAGIPAMQVFAGVNDDYHKTTDTTDKIDFRGMVKEAEFLKEIIDYLAGNSDFLNRAGITSTVNTASTKRKASTGLVPAFNWDAKGVKAEAITPGSPLSQTDFKAGDVIIGIQGKPIQDLSDYANELAKYSPGDEISLTYLSGSQEKTLKLYLTGR